MTAPVFVRQASQTGTSTSATISIQSDGTDRCIVAFVANRSNVTPSGATYNGSAMTRYNPGGFPADTATYNDGDGRFTVWYIVAPTVTTANVVVSWGSSADYDIVICHFTGVHQSTPLVNGTIEVNLLGATVTSVSEAPTSTTDHLMIGALAIGNFATTSNSGAGQTRLGTEGWTRVDSEAGAAGTTTLSFSWTGAESATLIAFALEASVPSTGPALVSLSPADDSQNVVPTQTLVITFNENVQAVSGNITVTETGVGTVEVISVTSPQVVFSTTTCTITLTQPLARDKAYDVQIAAGAIESAVDAEDWIGITSALGWNFDTYRATWRSQGSAAYSGTNPAPAYPASVAAGDALILVVVQKPSSANGGTVTTPASPWALIAQRTGATDGDTGGYTTTLGADTGNMNIYVYAKVADGTESGTLTVTTGTTNSAGAEMYRLTKAADCTWDFAGTTGKDTSAGNVSITFDADPGVRAFDIVIAAMAIPTDVTTPAQFTSESFSQTGVTFGSVTEDTEFDSGTGNDMGGFSCHVKVATGLATAAPVLTATAGGTTTNVRGPGIFLRARAVPPTQGVQPTAALRQVMRNAIYRM